jgi:hypothetical protein
MKIVVLNYTGDRGNWGCQATSENLLLFLRMAFGGTGDLNILTVPFPRENKIDRLQEAVYGDFIRETYLSDCPSTKALEQLERLTTERFGHFAEETRNADLVIFQGEGTIGPSTFFRNTRLFGLPFIAACLWRKPVYAMNQTIYACNHADSAALAGILRRFDLLAVREMASLNLARRLRLNNAVLCPDMAFAPEAPSPDRSVDERPYFCVTGSAAAEYYDHDMFVAVVKALKRALGLDAVYLYSRGNDGRLADEEVFQGRVFTNKELPHYSHLNPLFQKACFVFGGRYHSAITAMANGTPALLLPGNTFKSEGMGPMLGIDCQVFDISEIDAIVAEARAIMADLPGKRLDLELAVGKARQFQQEFAEVIRAMALRTSGEAALLAPFRSRVPERHVEVRFGELYQKINWYPERRGGILHRMALQALRATPGFQQRVESTFVGLT